VSARIYCLGCPFILQNAYIFLRKKHENHKICQIADRRSETCTEKVGLGRKCTEKVGLEGKMYRESWLGRKNVHKKFGLGRKCKVTFFPVRA